VSDSEVSVYDSIFIEPTYHTLKPIAAITNSSSDHVQMYLEKVQMQVHPNDCGVYAIAFLTDLCFDKDTATCCYDHRVIRSHLNKCFEAGQMTPFPSTATRKKNSVPK